MSVSRVRVRLCYWLLFCRTEFPQPALRESCKSPISAGQSSNQYFIQHTLTKRIYRSCVPISTKTHRTTNPSDKSDAPLWLPSQDQVKGPRANIPQHHAKIQCEKVPAGLAMSQARRMGVWDDFRFRHRHRDPDRGKSLECTPGQLRPL